MSHTYKFGTTTFICNSDLSGPIEIRNVEGCLEVDGEDILALVVDFITREHIAGLEQVAPRELIGHFARLNLKGEPPKRLPVDASFSVDIAKVLLATKDVDTMLESLSSVFFWKYTPQGVEYWEDVSDRIRRDGMLPLEARNLISGWVEAHFFEKS